MAITARGGSRARQVLDARLDVLRPVVSAGARPSGGWIRAIREALGMPLEDFAARLQVTKSTASRLEASEREGRVQLESMRRAAAALECDLVVALVPRHSLEETVRARARERALIDMGYVEHTMDLEDQALGSAEVDHLVDDLAAELMDQPGLWRRS